MPSVKKLRRILLSLPPEPVSAYLHLFGALLAILGLVLLVVKASYEGNAWHVVSYSIYGASMILLYTASTLYHIIPTSEKIRERLNKFDHSMIFFFIAGTYTPICLVPLRGAWGWSLFGVVWGLAIAGVIFSLFWKNPPRWLYLSNYIALGWIFLIAIHPIFKSISATGFVYLALGGLVYSVGAIIYGLKKPNSCPHFGSHEVWHVFVMVGSFFHFFTIWGLLG
jgi:hemolysin III